MGNDRAAGLGKGHKGPKGHKGRKKRQACCNATRTSENSYTKPLFNAGSAIFCPFCPFASRSLNHCALKHAFSRISKYRSRRRSQHCNHGGTGDSNSSVSISGARESSDAHSMGREAYRAFVLTAASRQGESDSSLDGQWPVAVQVPALVVAALLPTGT